MEYKKWQDALYLRVDKGEPVIASVKAVCRQEGIEGGSFQGIGACDEAVLATWIPEKQKFLHHKLTGMLEMISVTGNLSMDREGSPYSHSHAVFSYLDEAGHPAVAAGHLEDARISYTGEIVIRPAGGRIGRKFSEESGIEIWDLPSPVHLDLK